MMKKAFDQMIKKLDFGGLFNRPKKKDSVLKDLIRNPDSFVLTAYVEDSEIKISIKKRMLKEDES